MAGFSICSCTARWHSENDTSHHPPNGQISWLLLYRRDIVFLSSTIYFIFLPLTGGKRSGLISDDRYILKKKKINPVRVLKYLLKCPSSHDYEFQKIRSMLLFYSQWPISASWNPVHFRYTHAEAIH
jgi:hypothetical protein